ncbi:MarR family winged helix-turn-helix transcriptional regulator, partial [Cellulosimicrobium cellulans]|uniref:MarR family winged helix-turn-helix transcriptional regulator n=1 Tax=Cellulosimicrobium cellulans TaxID=1710 RepID=UPI0014830F8C
TSTPRRRRSGRGCVASRRCSRRRWSAPRRGTTSRRAEFDVLAALRRAGRPLRAGEVTTMTGAPGASITKRLDRLERAGLVERTVAERDRRGVLVALTDAGTTLVDEVFPQQLDRERAALVDLDEAERAELARLLAVVLRRLDPVDY